MGMVQSLKKIIYMMSSKEKVSFIKLSFLIILMSVLDTIGITSIIPFFSLASDPNNIYKNKFLNLLYFQFNFESQNQFLIAIGLLCIIAFTISTVARLLTQVSIFKFSYFFEYGLGTRILNKSLSKDYNFFITKHSSEFGEKILTRVEQLIRGFILPLINIFANIFLLLVIFILLIALDFKLTLTLTILLTTFYFLINIFLSDYITILGKKRLETYRKKFKILSELLGGIKEIKIFNSSEIFLKSFSGVSFDYASAQSKAKSLSLIPRFGIELLALVTVISIILIKIVLTKDNFVSIISYLSVYTVAGYKLLPTIQQIFNQNLLLKYNKPLLDSLYKDYKILMTQDNQNFKLKEIKIRKNIRLENISYCYPGSKINSLEKINVNFESNKSSAIVGTSGSGKSTLIDVLIGLLKLENGKIFIDEKNIPTNNGSCWNSNFSVVPQSVFILDDSIIANITFGIDPNLISMERVKYAARIACLDKFINENMSKGYLTNLGERGIKLSGGQKQRIAIARAIYRGAKFIIFDEATSELDSLTEKQIISNIRSYKRGGVISIAHRISTIKDFDEILLMKNGSLIAKGTFQELMEFEDFKSLVIAQKR